MFGRLRSLILIVLAAVGGAILGRIALRMREQMEAGESPSAVDPRSVTLRVQDVVPGLVAAFRVNDAPWSWFHIPSWMAAFGVNFGLAAVGGDITRLREQAERAAFEFAGLDARDFGLGGADDDDIIEVGASDGADSSWTPPAGPGSGPTPASGTASFGS